MVGSCGFFGLCLSKSLLFGLVCDEDGNIYFFVCLLMVLGGMFNLIKFYYLNNYVDGVNLCMDYEKMVCQVLMLLFVQILEGDMVCWINQFGEVGNGWEIIVNSECLIWCEDGLF